MNLQATRDNIFFKFEDSVVSGMFFDQTKGGIIVGRNSDFSAKEARWGVVVNCGPDCTEVVQGDRILIEPLMWSNGFEFEGQQLWCTNETKIMLVDSGE